MKITTQQPPENQNTNRNIQNVQKPVGTEQAEKAAPAKQPAPADKVDISGRSREIADIMSSIDQLPDVRAQKVQELKQAVDGGTYSIDPQKIAEKLLKDL
jgi:negative regulator of flagellin synthesis FlgM